eukprot:SM000090S24330  [mRNA]  locus=s90:359168:366788:+ [translate_table: standard]
MITRLHDMGLDAALREALSTVRLAPASGLNTSSGPSRACGSEQRAAFVTGRWQAQLRRNGATKSPRVPQRVVASAASNKPASRTRKPASHKPFLQVRKNKDEAASNPQVAQVDEERNGSSSSNSQDTAAGDTGNHAPSTSSPSVLPPPLPKYGKQLAYDSGNKSTGALILQTVHRHVQRSLPQQKSKIAGITVDDLMSMIKDAEKNILLLNRVRTRALEELDQAKASKEKLEAHVKALQKRLLEVEERLDLATQSKARGDLIEEEVAKLQKRLRSLDVEGQAAAQARREAEEQQKQLQQQLTEASQRAARSAELEEENRSLIQEVNILRGNVVELGNLHEKLEKLDNLRIQNEALQSQVKHLQMEASSLQEARHGYHMLESESQRVRQELADLKDLLSSIGAYEQEVSWQARLEDLQGKVAESEELKLQIERLKGQFEAEKEALNGETSSLKSQQLSPQEGTADQEQLLQSLQSQLAILRGDASQLEESRARESALQAQVLELNDSIAKLTSQAETKKLRILDESLVRERGIVEDLTARAKMEKQERLAQEQAAHRRERELVGDLQLLQSSIGAHEVERELFATTREEKEKLQQQVEILREQLLRSDDQIRRQVELYHSEVELLQASVASLTVDVEERESFAESGHANEEYPQPVDRKSWEFWTHLLLRIDSLVMSNLLSHEQGTELRLMTWSKSWKIQDAYRKVKEEVDSEVAATLQGLVKPRSSPGMHIIHIAAEMASVAKVGGLGDVVTGLGKALQKNGHLVEVILPKYDCMDYSRAMDYDLMSYFDGAWHHNKVWQGSVEGLPVYFIEPLHPGRYFWRKAFYGESDDFQRFTYFCRAALELVLKAGKRPDIIHCHDWQTAAVAPLYWDIYVPQGLDSAQVAFTCHNFEYQGTASPEALGSCGLDVYRHFRMDRLQDNFMLNSINLLKGGLIFSNLVTTVSPTYAVEVRGPEGGRGLHVTLNQIQEKFYGVLNGVDYEVWDPSSDPHLQFNFDSEDLRGKVANKIALRSLLGLASTGPDGRRPLRDFEAIAKQFESHPQIRLILKYDESLSHMIYAACDILVIPSIFEPCGLTQLIAMRYGAIPVVRKTGGLADSVFDVDDPTIPEEQQNGFTFTALDEAGLNFALDRAITYFTDNREWWEELVSNTMRLDYSWDESCRQYIALYAKLRVLSKT